VQDLQQLDNMYKFSMKWFIKIFEQLFKKPDEDSEDEESKMDSKINESGEQLRKRRSTQQRKNEKEKVTTLKDYEIRAQEIKLEFRQLLYRNVCMSLFESHKLLFAFFIALKVFEKDQTFEA